MEKAATPEFDALAATRRLVAAGVEQRPAEVIAGAVRNGRVGLATKADLDNLEAHLDARFASLETRMNRVAVTIVLAQKALTSALTAGLTIGLLEMCSGA